MDNIELEEGEAYFFQDDDEKIDPDRDFSYIDRKIENLLGQHRNDFMHGYSVECRGPRYGDYGSFLPMYERSPPLLPNQKSQSLASSKLPPNLSSEHFSENRTVAANTSLTAKSMPVTNDQTGKSGIPNVNSLVEVKNSAYGASNQQLQPMKPIVQSTQNSLKFRVKMASESVLPRDNTALYSGLGLDMSPTSSPEGSPFKVDRASLDIQEIKRVSPSFIIEIMTSVPLPNDALVSPLHDDLICLMNAEKTLETSLPGMDQLETLDNIHDSAYFEGRKEASGEGNPGRKDTIMKKYSKQNEATMEKNPKENITKMNPAESVNEDDEVPANASDFGAIRREDIGTLVSNKAVSNTSINASDTRSKETGQVSDSKPSIVCDKKSEVGCVAEEMRNLAKQGQVGRHKEKEEFALEFSGVTLVEEGKFSKIKNKSEDVKIKIATPKVEHGTDKKNQFGRGEDEANKFLKQHRVKDIVKEEEFDIGCPKQGDDYRKQSGKQEKIAILKDVGLVSVKDGKASNKHVDIHQEMKHHDSGYFGSSKKKMNIKEVTGPSLEEPSLSFERKKLKERQTGNASSTEPLRRKVASSSGPDGEDAYRNIPSRSKIGGIDLPKEMRKGIAAIENHSKKAKDVSSREIVMGPFKRTAQPSASKMKEQLSSKKSSFANTGPKLEGEVPGANCLSERFPVGELPPPENTLVPLETDDWVLCEKCQKWRLLPFGMNPDSLPKKWICSMLTWLPGMNKCSISEDETTQALRTMYLPSALGPVLMVQNNQHDQLDGFARENASSRAQHVGLSNPVLSGDVLLSRGTKKNFTKLENDAAVLSGAQDVHRPTKEDTKYSAGIRNPKNLKKLPLEATSASKYTTGVGRPSKIPKKRMAEAEVSGVPKKMKTVHQQSMERPIVVGLLPLEPTGGYQNYDLNASQISRDVDPRSSESIPLKVKNRNRSVLIPMDDDVDAVSENKRKLKDQQKSFKASSTSGDGPLNNLVTERDSGPENRKETKTSTSNIEAKESNVEKGHHGNKGNGRGHNIGSSGVNQGKGSWVGPSTLDLYQADRRSQKAADAKISSEKALDLGLSDNTTSSNSSKVSIKVKSKAFEVKCSPVGSISSSSIKICKSDPDKEPDKVAVSYNEAEELSSKKRLKLSTEGACVPHEIPPRNEEIKSRKSNLSRISSAMPDAAHEDYISDKGLPGRHSSAHEVGSQPKLRDFDCRDVNLVHRHHDGENVASQRNSENQMPNGSHFNGTSSDRQKLLVPEMCGEKNLTIGAHAVPDFEKGSGSISLRVDDGSDKFCREVLDDQASLRHPQHASRASNVIEASSSTKLDNFHTAAKTALKEAKDLKHSANRLKTAGSGLSTGLFFQAALKFLHGASLLEPGTNENGRIGEMLSTDVYSSSAKLCEYCAHEYEKCNDMASAALAYKCMEVAYMRVVYYNDVAASRDRAEVQMAVRAAPQVESPSSSASDIDNLNNQVAVDSVRDGHTAMDHRSHVISAINRPNLARLLNFTQDINLAMEASRRSLSSFAVANPILSQEGNEEGVSCIKRVLDFSFHDVDGLLHLVRRAMEALNN